MKRKQDEQSGTVAAGIEPVEPAESAAETPPTEPETQNPGRLRRWLPSVFLLLLIVSGLALWWQQDNLKDWLKLRNYQPSQEIQNLTDATTMTDFGKRLFYVNAPIVEERDTFNEHCSAVAEHEAAVLGCFVGDRLGIYIYNITDERLGGIKQVTAAHEMLHQAYERLSSSERERIDGLLQTYATGVTDKNLQDKLEIYKKNEPREIVNEMHSVFGTEVVDLPAELETYYARYFTDRQKVVAFHQQYRAAFDLRIAQIAAYDKQLGILRTSIDTNKKLIEDQTAALHQRRAEMDSYLDKKQTAAYNAAVPGYNNSVSQYKKLVSTTNEMIASFNDLVAKRNAIAVEEQELIKAQDSQVLSAQTR